MFILLWRLVLTPSTCHIIPGNPEMLLCEVYCYDILLVNLNLLCILLYIDVYMYIYIYK